MIKSYFKKGGIIIKESTRAKNLRLKSPGNCIICKKRIEKSSYSNEMLCGSECHGVNFWNEAYQEFISDTAHSMASIDGGLYYIRQKKCFVTTFGTVVEKDILQNAFMGHAGRSFYIKFDNGIVVYTTDLWFNGNIHKDFVEKIASNAEFISKEQFDKEVAIAYGNM